MSFTKIILSKFPSQRGQGQLKKKYHGLGWQGQCFVEESFSMVVNLSALFEEHFRAGSELGIFF